MLNVLYLPIGSQPGTVDAFNELGVNLDVYDFTTAASHSNIADVNKVFLNKVRQHNPDLIHMQLQMTNIISNHSLIEARKLAPNAIITNWTGDIRERPSSSFVSASRYVNYSLLSHVGQLEMYKNAGCVNARYWQIGYDPKRYFPQNKTNFLYNACFAGNNYGNTFPDGRLRLLIAQTLKRKYGARCGVFGSGYPSGISSGTLPIEKVNESYNNSICTISVSNFNDVSHYFSDRLLMCLASGRPTVAYRFPKYDTYFGHMNDILIANSVDEVINMVDFCVNNIDEANRIGKNGWAKVHAEHSFTSRIIELLSFTKLIDRI